MTTSLNVRARQGNRRTRALARLAVAGLTCATLAAAAPAERASATATPPVVITGYLTGIAANQLQYVKVMLIPTSATPVTVSVLATPKAGHTLGEFAMSVPRIRLGGASLSIVKQGRYLGPVTLNWKTGRGFLRFHAPASTTTHMTLGRIVVAAAYGRLATQLGAAFVDGTHPVWVDAYAKPVGAGNLGHVKKKLAVAAAMGAAAMGVTAGDPCAQHGALETGPGGDCDGDGIPNAVDVDDNGNLSLDITDSASAGTTAALNPWATLYLDPTNTLNANIGALTSEQIAATIGGKNVFSLNFFLDQLALTPMSSTPSYAVWVNCATIAWCNSSTGTAVIGGFSETPGFVSGPWKSYRGDDWNSGSSSPLAHPAPSNGLARLHTNWGQPGVVWIGGVQPRDGSAALTDLVPGQTFGLDYSSGSGTTEVPMSLSPYPVTVPAVDTYTVSGAGATAVDYSALAPAGSGGNPITVGADGTLGLTFWRPQRLALPGESGFQDLGNLHYGLILNNGGPELGCSSDVSTGYYNSVSGTLHRTPDPVGPYAMNLWPLTDTASDAAPSPSRTLSLTIDVRQCLIDHDVTIGVDGVDITASLTAAGAPMSGGANRAAQSLHLHIDPAS